MSAASSWGDLVREIEASKKYLPWELDKSLKLEPTRAVKLKEVKEREREVDPILMRYRDNDRETQHAEQRARADAMRNKLKDHQGGNSMFALIGHSSRVEDNTQNTTRHPPREERNGSKYHILSKLTLNKHQSAPTLYDEKTTLVEIARTQNGILSQARPRNDHRYDILSNQFIENHDATSAAERARLESRLKEAFERTHEYDCIRMTYYDPAREAAVQERELQATREQGKQQRTRLPPTVVRSEGSEYDIISLDAREEGELRSDSLALRHLSRVTSHGVERLQQERGQDAYERAEERRLRRVSQRRLENQLTHAMVPDPRAAHARNNMNTGTGTAWDRVQTSPAKYSTSSALIGYESSRVSARDEQVERDVFSARVRPPSSFVRPTLEDNTSYEGSAVSSISATTSLIEPPPPMSTRRSARLPLPRSVDVRLDLAKVEFGTPVTVRGGVQVVAQQHQQQQPPQQAGTLRTLAVIRTGGGGLLSRR